MVLNLQYFRQVCGNTIYNPLYGNNIRKCFIESDFLAICSGIPPLKLLFFRKVAGKYEDNPLKL